MKIKLAFILIMLMALVLPVSAMGSENTQKVVFKVMLRDDSKNDIVYTLPEDSQSLKSAISGDSCKSNLVNSAKRKFNLLFGPGTTNEKTFAGSTVTFRIGKDWVGDVAPNLKSLTNRKGPQYKSIQISYGGHEVASDWAWTNHDAKLCAVSTAEVSRVIKKGVSKLDEAKIKAASDEDFRAKETALINKAQEDFQKADESFHGDH